MSHIELCVGEHPQILLLDHCLSWPIPQLGTPLTHVQDLAFGLVEFHEVCTNSPLQPAKVCLDGIPSTSVVTALLDVAGKLAEATIHPAVHDANKDVTMCQS